MKTNFIRKATSNELIPQDEFVIEKEVVIDRDLFECFIKDPLNDYDFIKENLELIFCDNLSVFQCILSHRIRMILESWLKAKDIIMQGTLLIFQRHISRID